MYATNGKIKKVGNVQVSSLKIKGSGQNSNFDNSIPQTEENVKYYQAQIDASKEWADKQSQLQQEQTDFTIEKIEQQKDQEHNIEFSVGILENGEKVAYAKKFYGYDAELTKKIQATETRRLTNTPMDQQPAYDPIISQNSEKSIGK